MLRPFRTQCRTTIVAACCLAFALTLFSDNACAQESSTGARVAIAESQPEPGFFKRVDSLFAEAVDAVAAVLFYRVGKSDREYVVVQAWERFERDAGADGPYERVAGDPTSDELSDTLSSTDVEKLEIDGRLVAGPFGQFVREGEIDGRKVEFVAVKLTGLPFSVTNGQKYVLNTETGNYHLILPMHQAESRDEFLTPEQIEQLAEAGYLQTVSSDDGPTHTQSESIGGAPLIVIWLSFGAIFFTLYMGFVNLWAFRHAIDVVRGTYDNPEAEGEVSHFQALASALSATVGLGNIAGVTIAMTMGGPGAFFWMLLCGFFGMASKFTECTLGQKYRTVKPDGTVLGGPMRYLHAGLAEMGLAPLGLVLSLIFTVMCVFASFGGGNMFQANQSGTTVLAKLQNEQVQELVDVEAAIKTAIQNDNREELESLRAQQSRLKTEIDQFEKWFRAGYGLVLAFFVAIVIIGGIRRIGAAAEKIVPTMCVIYMAACLWIILSHIDRVPLLIMQVLTGAFNSSAIAGGFVGVLVIGVQRAAFSNEAGVGSAAIAHSAAKTKEPVREGIVALMGPFIDTIVVCSMTALVILITGAWNNSAWIIDEGREGASLTAKAFGDEISWFPWILCVAVVLFAYSTIISWSYYGERAWETLFGPRSTIVYKVLAVTAVFLGAIFNLGAVLDFSDMMILSMAFPNILGALLLAPKVKRDLSDYWRRYKAGEFKIYK